MGFLEKYVAYRASQRSGGGGSRPVGLAFLIALAVVLFFALPVLVLKYLGTTVYEFFRPILMINPPLGAFVGGLFISSLPVLLIGRYPRETAQTILSNDDSNDDGLNFYVRAFCVSVLMMAVLTYVVVSGGDFLVFVDDVTPVAAVGALVANTILTVAFFYTIYKLFALLYRYHRLVQYAPAGKLYTVGMYLPFGMLLTMVYFQLPESGISIFGQNVLGVGLLGATVLCTYFLPIAAIRYRAEAHILSAATDTDTEDTTTDDIAVDTSATRTTD